MISRSLQTTHRIRPTKKLDDTRAGLEIRQFGRDYLLSTFAFKETGPVRNKGHHLLSRRGQSYCAWSLIRLRRYSPWISLEFSLKALRRDFEIFKYLFSTMFRIAGARQTTRWQGTAPATLSFDVASTWRACPEKGNLQRQNLLRQEPQ